MEELAELPEEVPVVKAGTEETAILAAEAVAAVLL
jgi:hypothetical protein